MVIKAQLWASDGTPRYNAMVLTNGNLGYGYYQADGLTSDWAESALTEGVLP